MKKVISILLILSMCLTMCMAAGAPVFAAGSVTFILADADTGETNITAAPGETVEIVLKLAAGQTISSFQDEITYDDELFQLVPDSNKAENGVKTSDQESLSGEKYVFFNSYNSKKYEAEGTAAGTFRLRINGFEGTGTVKSTGVIVYSGENEKCTPSTQDLVITIDGEAAGKATFKEEAKGKTIKELPMAENDNTLIFPEGPEKKGYTFNGWVEETDTSVLYQAGKLSTVKGINKTYVPSFTPAKYKINLDAQAGGTVMATQNGTTFTSGSQAEYDSEITLNATPSTGYEFAGWTDGNTDNPRTVKVEGPATYTAKFSLQKTEYTLSFNTNGGSAIDPVKVSKGSEISLAKYTTTRTDYTFNGWYSDPDFKNKITSIVMNTDKTVYAGWLTADGKQAPAVAGGGGTESGGENASTSAASVQTTTAGQIQTAFVDVKTTDYFYDAVVWAVSKGITSGTDGTHFSPNGETTRAQMVTFLWRAAGSPEPVTSTSAFTDVVSGSYYEKAVGWGVEHGYVKGISDTEFGPDQNVTRAQAVTFMSRQAGVKDTDSGYTNNFVDVHPGDYFYNAVSWAVSKGITKGTSDTTFSPNDNCLRCQIVVFLYRA